MSSRKGKKGKKNSNSSQMSIAEQKAAFDETSSPSLSSGKSNTNLSKATAKSSSPATTGETINVASNGGTPSTTMKSGHALENKSNPSTNDNQNNKLSSSNNVVNGNSTAGSKSPQHQQQKQHHQTSSTTQSLKSQIQNPKKGKKIRQHTNDKRESQRQEEEIEESNLDSEESLMNSLPMPQIQSNENMLQQIANPPVSPNTGRYYSPDGPKSPSHYIQKFHWKHGGEVVVVTGTFDDWKQTILMKKVPGTRDEFFASVELDRSNPIQFKFVVDGEWRCSTEFETQYDFSGNLNNFLPAITTNDNNAFGW